MKVKLILMPRFAKTWVHFDHLLVDAETNKECGYMRSKGSWGYEGQPFPSFRHDIPINYIASGDKKKWRKKHPYCFCDNEVKTTDFNKRHLEIYRDKQYERRSLEFVDVTVQNPVYIDPKTATVWMYRKTEKDIYSKRAWLFKQMPNPEITPIWFMDNNSFFWRKNKMCATAFLSGELLKKLCSWRDDPRKFLYEKPKKDKQCIIKSVTRQLKKLIKTVKPISEQTKNFFKLAGAFKHLKTQQKYAN